MLFASDFDNHRVLVYDVNSIENGEPARFVLGQQDFVSGSFAVTQAGMYHPYDLSYDGQRKYLYVPEWGSNRLTIFNVGTITNGQSAINVLGKDTFTDGTEPPSPTATNLRQPRGTSYDASTQRLFVADRKFNRVLVYDLSTIANGEAAVNVIGQDDFTSGTSNKGSGDNGPPNQAGLENPREVEFDGVSKRLYVADGSNSRVLMFKGTNITNGMAADYVLGQPNFTSRTGGTSRSRMWFATGLAVDTVRSRLFTVEFRNNRALVFDTSTITNGQDALYVLGQQNFTSNMAARTANGMYVPMGAVYDEANNRLFVSDSSNNRILVWDW